MATTIRPTRSGVYYALEESEWTVQLEKFTLHFSSKFYKDKFLDLQKEHRDTVNYMTLKRYGVAVDNSLLADLDLYQKVQTRGLYISWEGGSSRCLKNLILTGLQLKEKT
jgi:hypothetical protein